MDQPHHGVFRYYLPGVAASDVTAELVAFRGLADRLGECVSPDLAKHTAQVTAVRSGPDGGSGALVVPMPADGGLVARSEYAPQHQDWHKSELCDYWIGMDRDHPPEPDGLVRRETVAGYEHELGDGRAWTCPTIRRGLVVSAVPAAYARMNGRLTRTPLPRYRPIWDESLRWAAQYFSGMTPEDGFAACVQCLAVNYRVGVEEVSLLGLLTDFTLPLVLEAALDVPWLEEALSGRDPEKKRVWELVQAALASGAPGSADSCPITAPATPT